MNKTIDKGRNPMEKAGTHDFLLRKTVSRKPKTIRRCYEVTREQDKKIKDLAWKCQCPEYRLIQKILDEYFGENI